MKRSQMLNIILDTLKEEAAKSAYRSQEPSLIYAQDDGEVEVEPQLAELILGVMEQAGMLPPSYVGLMANGRKYNRETDFARDTMDFRGTWEPEHYEN
jgi:hypothetical protein